jgi:chromate transporter
VGAFEVLFVFLRLGCVCFGGPVAHLGYFRAELVERRKWLNETTYGELVGLCQFLPGPASSQVGFSIGLMRAGLPGGLAAWVGFTTPSAVLMLAFATGLNWLNNPVGRSITHSLVFVAMAVVAQAVWNLGRRLCPDKPRLTMTLVAAALVLFIGWPFIQLVVIATAAVIGRFIVRPNSAHDTLHIVSPVPRAVGTIALAAFFVLLAAALATPGQLFSDFYRAGALVFGGGHVVLPLLQDFVAQPRGLPNSRLLTGYGAAQAIPGPLFTFAAYLGAVVSPRAEVLGGLVALVAIFLPGLLLVIGVFPFWARLRTVPYAQSALAGVNAAVVGLLLAALARLLLGNGPLTPESLAVLLLAFLLLEVWRVPSWMVVMLAVLIGAVMPYI